MLARPLRTCCRIEPNVAIRFSLRRLRGNGLASNAERTLRRSVFSENGFERKTPCAVWRGHSRAARDSALVSPIQYKEDLTAMSGRDLLVSPYSEP